MNRIKWNYLNTFNFWGFNQPATWENWTTTEGLRNEGVAVRIEEALGIQTANIELFIAAIAGILALLIIVFGIAILWNQRKIKKMLRQIQEQNVCASKNETQQESNQP